MTRSQGCDLVIEAATENVELKVGILRQVDALAQPDGVLATNTSSISITQLAAVDVARRQRFIGMHFFNPVPMMALVEMIRGLQTSDATVDARRWRSRSAGQDADRREEQSRLRRQPHPLPDDQRSHLRAAGRPRDRARTSTTA